MQRFPHWPKAVLVAAAGGLTALGVATGLTQAAAPTATTTTPTATTTTTKTTTTKTTPKVVPTPKATTRKITCSETVVATRAGGNNSENFGTVSCSAPFGEGVRHDTATLLTTSKTEGSFAGGVKLFFNTGTLRGRFRLAFTVAGQVAYNGTLRISSGTGEFAGVTGKGTTRGTSQDGVHSAITEKLTLKFPPKKTA
ncbi:MAG TPA: hypothetical protein VL120_05680 [Solirubrobacteraceae bacterium]|nr:hypothetical protein [Solirubrobacteraceae bacterium]